MSKSSAILAASCALLSLLSGSAYSQQAPAKPPPQSAGVDPGAVKILRGMTDYLGGLKQFSVVALNMREDMLISDHRVDYEVTSKVIVSRPNKFKVERTGHLAGQIFYYDGTTVTLYNPSDKVYASMPAPATIEEMLDFGRESLGLGYPISDIIYRNAFPLLMQDVTLALMIGKEVIGGVECEHLLFSRPGVDFQVWVPTSGAPLPRKYVVTDTGTPGASEHYNAHDRLERRSGRGRFPVQIRAAEWDPSNHVHQIKRRFQALTPTEETMKPIRIAVVATALALMLIPDVVRAQAGHMHRATRRRTAVVVGSAASASGAAQASQAQQQTAAAQQQTVAAQQQTVAAQQQAAAAQQQAAAAEKDAAAARQALAVAQGVLPLGTVVRTLPANCPSETVAGVEHYHCGGNYYRAAFEGNNLVYVTTQPK